MHVKHYYLEHKLQLPFVFKYSNLLQVKQIKFLLIYSHVTHPYKEHKLQVLLIFKY
jgi:hypothetical protein